MLLVHIAVLLFLPFQTFNRDDRLAVCKHGIISRAAEPISFDLDWASEWTLLGNTAQPQSITTSSNCSALSMCEYMNTTCNAKFFSSTCDDVHMPSDCHHSVSWLTSVSFYFPVSMLIKMLGFGARLFNLQHDAHVFGVCYSIPSTWHVPLQIAASILDFTFVLVELLLYTRMLSFAIKSLWERADHAVRCAVSWITGRRDVSKCVVICKLKHLSASTKVLNAVSKQLPPDHILQNDELKAQIRAEEPSIMTYLQRLSWPLSVFLSHQSSEKIVRHTKVEDEYRFGLVWL